MSVVATPATAPAATANLRGITSDWVDYSSRRKAVEFGWWGILWHLLLPLETHRTVFTPAGVFLFVVSLGIGGAAYNNSNNVLFMALSLMVSSLVLSGLLSWVNFRGVRWRLVLPTHFRAGEAGPARLELVNHKNITPTYCLLFRCRARRLNAVQPLYLADRLDPGAMVVLDWIIQPRERGLETIEIAGVESQFPFGFLRKRAGGSVRRDVWVWPAHRTYELSPPQAHRAHFSGEAQRRPGIGADLLGLRPYRTGDAPRLVHWKASARLRELVVRQTVEEQRAGYFINIDAPRALWSDPAQFECLCSFASSLAEDLFAAGRLRGVSVQGGAVQPVKRLPDLHAFFDQLARLEPAAHSAPVVLMGNNVITFQPASLGQVHAYIDNQFAGAA